MAETIPEDRSPRRSWLVESAAIPQAFGGLLVVATLSLTFRARGPTFPGMSTERFILSILRACPIAGI